MSNIQKAKITISGPQDCVYLYATDGDLNENQRNMLQELGPCPEWDFNTLFRIDFSTYLAAGSLASLPTPITGWLVYRKKGDEPTFMNYVKFPAKVHKFYDRGVVNNTDYVYYIYPIMETELGDPMVTEPLRTSFACWTLFLANPTEDKNKFTIKKAYNFALNFGAPSVSNNTTANVVTTFSRYQRVRKDTVNCLSGALSSLLGYYDAETKSYVETAKWADEMNALTTNMDRKFLRDLQGHMLEVEISGPLTATQQFYNGQVVSTAQLDWVEIADATNVLIIGDL